MLKNFKIETTCNDVFAITDSVKTAVEQSGVQEGICVVTIPHTTAALTITSFWDPNGFEDLQDEICRLIYFLEFDGPRKREYFVKVTEG